jgi:hypothetical protein
MLLSLIILLLFGFGCLSGALTEYQQGDHSPQTVGAIIVFGIAFFGPLLYIANL